ncbi:UPF0758 domain-containing protein [Pedobacter aquatilis]|uniref:UPF0758 domain-containing protein n=1 Tax=Pedobacter aquatilis TaxID=351343 RepID=UPI0029306125|nr:UPF0758 domain-containing protein [Pedobacter aquatilis]
MKNKVIASESFSNGSRHFFLDFMLARNNTNYIRITRSDEQKDGTYARSTVRVFQEDFEFLIGCFAALFRSAAYAGEHVHVKDMKSSGSSNTIKDWPECLRPREKMLEHGKESMADEELLSMLLGSGTPHESAVELSKRILEDMGFDLIRLGSLNQYTLCQFSGMGIAKSSSVMAAMELGRRAYGFF